MLYLFDFPMLRHLPNPLDARVLHLHIGIEPLCDHMADQCLAFFFEQLNKGLLFLDQTVDALGFAIKECANLLL